MSNREVLTNHGNSGSSNRMIETSRSVTSQCPKCLKSMPDFAIQAHKERCTKRV